eukprot:3937123-Rhodomonas_salina.1
MVLPVLSRPPLARPSLCRGTAYPTLLPLRLANVLRHVRYWRVSCYTCAMRCPAVCGTELEYAATRCAAMLLPGAARATTRQIPQGYSPTTPPLVPTHYGPTHYGPTHYGPTRLLRGAPVPVSGRLI